MKYRPILFSGEMVRAILEGRKTQTRRVVKMSSVEGFDTHDMWHSAQQVRDGSWIFWSCKTPPSKTTYESGGFLCPYGQPGDRLWVRETYQLWQPWGSDGDEWIGDEVMEFDGRVPKVAPDEYSMWKVAYKADEPELCKWWRPSIFMPRWASRITLEIVNVRVERLQEISRDDARAEGMSNIWAWGPERDRIHFSRAVLNPFVANFSVLWDEINSKRGFGWDVNPWVWVIEFKCISGTE